MESEISTVLWTTRNMCRTEALSRNQASQVTGATILFIDKDSDRLGTDDESDNSDMISDDNDELESEETCVREVADAARDAETDTDCAPHSQSDV